MRALHSRIIYGVFVQSESRNNVFQQIQQEIICIKGKCSKPGVYHRFHFTKYILSHNMHDTYMNIASKLKLSVGVAEYKKLLHEVLLFVKVSIQYAVYSLKVYKYINPICNPIASSKRLRFRRRSNNARNFISGKFTI